MGIVKIKLKIIHNINRFMPQCSDLEDRAEKLRERRKPAVKYRARYKN